MSRMELDVFLLLCCFLVFNQSTGHCPENATGSYESVPALHTLKNTYLKGHSITVILVSSILQCFFECLSTKYCDCVSINFEYQPNSEGLYLCDLKNQRKNTVNDSDMGEKEGVDHVDVLSHFTSIVRQPSEVDDGWPGGSYGLPQTDTGCPSAWWQTGARYQSTEIDNVPISSWSNPYHFPGFMSSSIIEQKFCMKSSTSEKEWPPGLYCIFKFGASCPNGMSESFLQWDDENTSKNKNKVSGTVPAGEYGNDTKIFYCCQTDGNVSTPIVLPSNKPFYLLKPKASTQCQAVAGMRVSEEWIFWDCEDDTDNCFDKAGLLFSINDASANPKLYYCYYSLP